MKTKKTLVLVGVSAVAGIVLLQASSQTASAGLTAPAACATVRADETRTFGANVSSVSATSPTTTYGHDGCDSYIVDVTVDASASQVTSEYTPSIQFAADAPYRERAFGFDVAKDKCGSVTERSIFYKKTASGYSLLGGGDFRGAWHEASDSSDVSFCFLVPSGTATWRPVAKITPPAAGSDTYRVAVVAHVGAEQLHVKAVAEHLMRPVAGPPIH